MLQQIISSLGFYSLGPDHDDNESIQIIKACRVQNAGKHAKKHQQIWENMNGLGGTKHLSFVCLSHFSFLTIKLPIMIRYDMIICY